MEPRREEPKVGKPRQQRKPKRFRLVRLEKRTAPHNGGGATNVESGGLLSIE
jgi:hypothetical protein